MHYPLLTLLILLPLLGASALFVLSRQAHFSRAQLNQNARWVALWVSGVNLALATFVLAQFDSTSSQMQFVEKGTWLPQFNIFYHLGVDGISILLVYLTALLTPICVLASWSSIKERVPAFMAAFLLLEAFVIGVFCALDSILFYIFWEAMLIPMFLIIGIWGGENRVYATLKFFIYTFVGSILMLSAIIYMGNVVGSFNILDFQNFAFDSSVQTWLFIAFFAAFAVKIPMWPFHTWLPDAHVQAPTAGSVILAGVLLKLGGYGFLRFNLPMFPDATALFTPAIATLSVIGIIYAALVAFAQTDIKKMIAYSSVSHMGFVTLGIFAGTQMAVEGAMLQMINHGIVSAALFLLIGLIYERMHTRNINRFGGVVNSMPVYAVIFLIMTLASVALPGTNSFVSEFMILAGSFPVLQIATIFACSGVVLGALYMLMLYRKMIMGSIEHDDVKNLTDINAREVSLLAPLVFLVVILGIQPLLALNIMRPTVRELTDAKPALITVQEMAPKNIIPKDHSHNHGQEHGDIIK